MYIHDMAQRYSIAEARANLSAIIDQTESGEPVELTRRGKAVAVLLSQEAFERLQMGRPRFVDAYRAFRQRFSLADVGLDDDFAERVRDRSVGRAVKL